VDAVVLLGEVVGPVFVEVAVAVNRSEFEDPFGAVKAPARAALAKDGVMDGIDAAVAALLEPLPQPG
jgi:hypothetical protein